MTDIIMFTDIIINKMHVIEILILRNEAGRKWILCDAHKNNWLTIKSPLIYYHPNIIDQFINTMADMHDNTIPILIFAMFQS